MLDHVGLLSHILLSIVVASALYVINSKCIETPGDNKLKHVYS